MEIFKVFLLRFSQHETARLAASTAFYTLFAFAPMLLLLTTLAGFLGLEHQIRLISQVRLLVGPEAAAAVKTIISAATTRADLTTVVGLSSALVWMTSASMLFGELSAALTKIFGGKAGRFRSRSHVARVLYFVRGKFFRLMLVFAFTSVALISLLVSSALAFLVKDHPVMVIRSLNVMISFAVYVVMFATAYLYIPAIKISFRRAAFGGLITSALFVVGKELIGLYLGRTAFGSVYGAAGTLVVLLIWIYYSSLIIFAGAELTMILVRERRSRVLASPEI